MAASFQTLPEELQLNIAQDHIESTQDLRNFRLACKTFARVGASALARERTTLYVGPSRPSLRDFTAICEHPLYRQKITKVVVVGDANFDYWSSLEAYFLFCSWKSNSTSRQDRKRVYGVPTEFHSTNGKAAALDRTLTRYASRSAEFAILLTGLVRLPRLSALAFAASWPRATGWNSSSIRDGTIAALADSEIYLGARLGIFSYRPCDFQPHVIADICKPHDWIALTHVLQAHTDIALSGKSLDLIIEGISHQQMLLTLSSMPTLSSTPTWSSTTRVGFERVGLHVAKSVEQLTTLELSLQHENGGNYLVYHYPNIENRPNIENHPNFFQQAPKLRRLRVTGRADGSTGSTQHMLLLLFRTTWSQLEDLSIEVEPSRPDETGPYKKCLTAEDLACGNIPGDQMSAFLLRHKHLLRSVHFRNLFCDLSRQLGFLFPGPPGQVIHNLDPFRCLAGGEKLDRVSIEFDVDHRPFPYVVFDRDFRLLQQSTVDLATNVRADKSVLLANDGSPAVDTYDFGPWLMRGHD